MNCRLISGIALILIILGCGQKTLTREDAAALIEKTPSMAIFTSAVPIHDARKSIEIARNQGIVMDFFSGARQEIIAGEKLLSEVDRSVQFDPTANIFLFKSKKPISLKVVVTGVTDDPNSTGMRQAEFNWKQNDLPPTVRRFAADGGVGMAKLRLFDDGWRVDEISLKVSQSGITLSQEEIALQKADIDTEITRRAVAAKVAADAAKVALERLNAAKAEKGILYRLPFTFQLRAGGIALARPREVEILISASHLYFPQEYEINGRYKKIWFGNIKDIAEADQGNVIVHFYCPDFNGPSVNFMAPGEKELRTRFISKFRSYFVNWMMEHRAFHGSQKCIQAAPVNFVR